MAKAQPGSVNSPAPSAGFDPAINADTPTPGNTPLPGGGSWHWDAAVPGWAENTPYTPTPAPITPLIQE